MTASPYDVSRAASSGLALLDEALGGGFYWGDNVVWEPRGDASAEPFYAAVGGVLAQHDFAAYVTLDRAPEAVAREHPGLEPIDARPGSPLAQAGALLSAIRRRCGRFERSLLLFDPLERMAARWGAETARAFFTRCCPSLLDLGAVAYWSLGQGELAGALRRQVEEVTQCVLVLGEGRLRIAKSEGRAPGLEGTVLRYRLDDSGRPLLELAPSTGRLGLALRALRERRQLTQAELARLAGISASAISQAERGERGLSLDTLFALSRRLELTLDELLGGSLDKGYRLARGGAGRRGRKAGQVIPHHDAPDAGLRTYSVRLAPRETLTAPIAHKGVELVAVASGLVQVLLADGRPVLRGGESLLADRTHVTGWRNLGDGPASLFWVLRERA